MYPKNKANTEAIHIGHFIQHKSLYLCRVDFIPSRQNFVLFYVFFCHLT